MWDKLKAILIVVAALAWGTIEVLNEARPGVLLLVGAMLGLPLAAYADGFVRRIGQRRNDSTDIEK